MTTKNNVIDLNEYKQKHKITFNQHRPFDITKDILSTEEILMKMGKELFKHDKHKPDTCSLIEQLTQNNKNKKKPNADDILDMIRDRNYLRITIKDPRKKKKPKKD